MNMLREIIREGFGQDFFGPSHTFCSTSGQGTGSDVGISKIMKELLSKLEVLNKRVSDIQFFTKVSLEI